MNSYQCERIGHGGASALAPANTLASFDAACELGVDMVEFDVRACGRELVLAHTIFHTRRPGIVRLQDALRHLSSRRFREIGLNVDLKRAGCERALVQALDAAGLTDRTLVSSQMPVVLDRTRSVAPHVRTGVSIGGRMARISRRWNDWRTQVLSGLVSRRWDAVMAQHRLVDTSLLEAVEDRRGSLYAWTVNDRGAIDRLRALGVHGIATADPRLFG